jgi:hypothetical protein
MRVYALACVDIMRFDIAKFAEQLTKKPENKPKEAQPQFRRGGWVSRW